MVVAQIEHAQANERDDKGRIGRVIEYGEDRTPVVVFTGFGLITAIFLAFSIYKFLKDREQRRASSVAPATFSNKGQKSVLKGVR